MSAAMEEIELALTHAGITLCAFTDLAPEAVLETANRLQIDGRDLMLAWAQLVGERAKFEAARKQHGHHLATWRAAQLPMAQRLHAYRLSTPFLEAEWFGRVARERSRGGHPVDVDSICGPSP